MTQTVSRNFDLLAHYKQRYSTQPVLAKKMNGSWIEYSLDQYIQHTQEISYGLLQLGISRGDKVAIVSFNRPEWNFIDFGASQLGAITVPMYPTAGEHDMAHILNDSEAKVIFVENKLFYDKLASIRAQTPSVQYIFSFDEIAGVPNWREVLEKGNAHPQPEKVEELKSLVQPDDLMTLIYTSGTTGNPKGVMLSHNNIISNVISAQKVCPVHHSDRVLSFLPLCHIFERMLCYMYHYVGASIWYAESMETIGDNLKEVKPMAFSTVPRLLEKVFDKIMAKGYELKGIKRSLFFWAVDLGLKYELHGKNGAWYNLQLKIANKLIFSKWREALGGNVEVIVSGAAALQPRLARIFTAAGINVLEGYGLTETSPVICVNQIPHEKRCFGTVGPTISGVEIKIAEDGEILCKGPNVMLGYYKNEAATREVMDADGWFHTGDIGMIVEGQFLKITDRKKEVFKTSGGKYIAPQPMENKFKESNYIEQIMVIGENHKHAAALIVPAWDALKGWCTRNQITFTTPQEMVAHPKVLELYQREMDTYNAGFGHTETVKKFALIPQDWSIDGGELTPTLKLKRKPILQKYNHLVNQIYGNES